MGGDDDALAGAQVAVDSLRRVANANGRRILHEATVGAGLPVIDTLEKLLDAGDTVLSIEGCPSGTLGFLFGELGRGERFSTALRAAIAAGYTEPDPRIDLSGLDVARKALILARAIGFRGLPVVVSVLLETMLLALAGGVLGAFVAWLIFNNYTVSTLGQNFSQVVFAFKVSPALVWSGLKWALAIGFIGGLFPAMRAARLPVTTALREL